MTFIVRPCSTSDVSRMLGFLGGKFTKESQFGKVPNDFSMDDVKCLGRETNLGECPHTVAENCNGDEGAGVICFKDGETLSFVRTIQT